MKQVLYICKKVQVIYFSKAACIDLSILPPCFPKPMTLPPSLSVMWDVMHPDPQLKQWLLDRFASTVFNNSGKFLAISGPHSPPKRFDPPTQPNMTLFQYHTTTRKKKSSLGECQKRHHHSHSNWYLHRLVLHHGHYRKEKWVTEEDSRLPASKFPMQIGNTTTPAHHSNSHYRYHQIQKKNGPECHGWLQHSPLIEE